jgi:hypothetical protein
VPALLVAASSYDTEKFCTILDHVMWYDESHTTSQRHLGVGWASSPSDLRSGCRDLCGPSDPLGQWC